MEADTLPSAIMSEAKSLFMYLEDNVSSRAIA